MSTSNSVTLEELTDSLLFAFHDYIKNGHISREEIVARAAYTLRDLHWINCEAFEFCPQIRIPLLDGKVSFPLAQYRFGENRNSIHTASPDQDVRDLTHPKYMEGTGVNEEDIRWFSDVCWIARLVIPQLWESDESIRRNLSTPHKHVSTLNELFWIGRWKGLDSKSVMHEAKLRSGEDGSVDWSFDCVTDRNERYRLNVEVKSLIQSLANSVHQLDLIVESVCCGLDKKFPSASTNEINVVCYTMYCKDPQILGRAGNLILAKFPSVDVVIIWVPVLGPPENIVISSRRGGDSKLALVRRFLDYPDVGQCRFLLLKHVNLDVLPMQAPAMQNLREARKIS